MVSTDKVSEAMARFLNGLPTGGEIIPWLDRFRGELRDLLGDVDLVMVDVNYLCDLQSPHSYEPTKVVTQHITEGREESVAIGNHDRRLPIADRLIMQARRGGFRSEEFHEPAVFEYRFAGAAYLGAIILWRALSEPPISADSLATMELLHPFLTFLLSDLVARHGLTRPIDRAFHQALDQISQELGLTDREQDILAMHLFGYPYQRIADQIHLSIDSVRKHVKSIHRKANVGTYTELFAKYFTPRIFAEGLSA
jgi:DNA-binding CsgD family transcriptional regulator